MVDFRRPGHIWEKPKTYFILKLQTIDVQTFGGFVNEGSKGKFQPSFQP